MALDAVFKQYAMSASSKLIDQCMGFLEYSTFESVATLYLREYTQ